MHTTDEATELKEQQPPTSIERPKAEFDPCRNAKITSPFYLYNHDSPRPSFDVKKPAQVDLQDVEAGTVDLLPTTTQEKQEAQNAATSRFKFWQRQKPCMTKPRRSKWLGQLPPWQRLLIKLLIFLAVTGAIVGIAVGISIRVHGGIYKSNNSTSAPIG